jgi:hypothetical protein
MRLAAPPGRSSRDPFPSRSPSSSSCYPRSNRVKNTSNDE